jgi:hypothetical protein
LKAALARLRGLLFALVGFGATGCPAVLDDSFTIVQPGAGGDMASGGTAQSMGGSPSGNGADGGNADTAGAPEQGGSGNIAGSGSLAGAAGSDMGMAGMEGVGGEPAVGLPCADCGPNEKCCNDVCVDTRFDPRNCMACGHGCPGTTCESSSCTNTCQQGFVDCNKNVVDGCEVNPASDPANCGNCGITCGFKLECVKGYCVCPTGTADCDSGKENGCETDITSDKSSCNGCGKACASGQLCADSKCECAVGLLDCNANPSDGCEASVTADDTCGSCALDCGPHGLCVAAGTCGCASGYLDCDAQVPGCETPVSDPANCGTCGVACPANLPACDGTQCIAGCGALTLCGASCVDTKTDPENCGACNAPVGVNQSCVAGAPTCNAGFADCDSSPGCEVNTLADGANCGGCNKPCKLGALCDSGSCACAPTTPNDCGATCAQCCNDGQCSDGNSCTADVCSAGTCSTGLQCAGGGKCCAGTGCFDCCSDTDCTGGKVCTSNQCVNLSCTQPQIACNLTCVNPTNDPKHCGSCDNNCGPGRACSASACTPKWVATSPPPAGFVARERAASAALGAKLFVWGGSDATSKALADGAIYDPATDTWTAVAATGAAPSARVLATAVWTGSVMVVWGGGDVAAAADYGTGSRFDPTTNTWAAMTTVGAPGGRRGAYGFWTGSRVLLYGGVDRNGLPSSAANLYDPVNDSWSSLSTQSGPSARSESVVGWSGSLLLVYGGRPGGSGSSDATFVLDVAANAWDRGDNGPGQRYGAFGTWDGSLLLAWGGATGLKFDGQTYEPSTDNWSPVQTSGAPTARYGVNRATGWTTRVKPRVSLLLGGYGAAGFLTNGATYNSTTNAWATVSSWPSGASHIGGAGVWTGSEFVLWGGRSGTSAALTSAGERYLP